MPSPSQQRYRTEDPTKTALSGSLLLPKASCVERLAALQPRLQVLEVVCELLVLSKLHHVVEMLDVLHHRVQLGRREGG